MQNNYLIKNEAEGTLTLRIHSVIDQSFWGDEVSADMVISQIEEAQPKSILVSINSNGGSVFEGLTIYNYLKSFKGSVKVEVDGIAASIASVIAMAGKTITMKEGSFLMIHDALLGMIGNAEDMRKAADLLDKTSGSLAGIYANNNRKGMTENEIREMMKAETWLTAEEAVEMGFADRHKQSKRSVSNEAMLKMVAQYNPPSKIVHSLNNNKLEKPNLIDQLKDFLGFKSQVEEMQNELVAPIKNEMEAKLTAAEKAKAEAEQKLADAQAAIDEKEKLANEASDLKAKIADMEAKMKASGAPQEMPSEDLSENQEHPENMKNGMELVEDKLLKLFPENRQKEYREVLARQKKIAELKAKKAG